MAAIHGQRHRGKEPNHQIGSGNVYRAACTLEPDDADKLVIAWQALADAGYNISVSGLLSKLVREMELDATGLPLWHEDLPSPTAPFAETQEAFAFKKAG